MPDIYKDGTYLDKNPSWHEEDSPWKASKIEALLERNALSPRTICEVGCGAGEILLALSRTRPAGTSFVGYEVSPQAFEICGPKATDSVRFELQDALENDSLYFDVVLAIDVFEHVEDYFSFLRKIKSRGEYKIFHVPLDLSVQTVLRASPIEDVRRRIGHIHYFTKETALETLKDTGHEIVDHFYTAFSLELQNRGWRVDLLKLPRKIAFALNQDLAVRTFGGFSLMVLTR